MKGRGKRAKRVNESKVTPCIPRRETHAAPLSALSVGLSALSVVVCRFCCCHFKLPIIDEFAKIQTDKQRQR